MIADWDLSTDINSRGAALGTCVLGSEWLTEQKGEIAPDPLGELIRCTDLLMDKVGRIDPLWGDINRHVRGDINIPIGGGPDTLRAIYGMGLEDDGFLTNVAGDGLYYQVSWDTNGQLKVQGTHQFGSATLDADSPHFGDQLRTMQMKFCMTPYLMMLLDKLNLKGAIDLVNRVYCCI